MEVHRLSSVDLVSRTAVCSVCGPTKIRVAKNGKSCWTKVLIYRRKWSKTPAGKAKKKRQMEKRRRMLGIAPRPEAYRKHVKKKCERCGWVAPIMAVMDGHHKDMNRKNNNPSNIESLCPICHRLVHLGRTDLINHVEIVVASKPRFPELGVSILVKRDPRDKRIEELEAKIKEYEQMYG